MKALENATQGTLDVAAERMRQIDEHAYTATWDSGYLNFQLLYAADAYMRSACTDSVLNQAPPTFPWSEASWRPTTPRRDLVKAAALIIAEIDRMDAEQKEKAHE